jgi:hypothetical protein
MCLPPFQIPASAMAIGRESYAVPAGQLHLQEIPTAKKS